MTASTQPQGLPTERRPARPWIGRVLLTVIAVTVNPWRSFADLREPVDHAAAVAYLATLRLPIWLGVLVGEAVMALSSAGGAETIVSSMGPPTVLTPIFGPDFVSVVGLWLLLMVPLGLGAIYVLGGLLAHLGLMFTGEMPRSVGASMRAFAYAAGPAILLLSVVEVLLRFGEVAPELWLATNAAAFVGTVFWLGVALAKTHGCSMLRSGLVALVPAAVLVGSFAGRALFELQRYPFMPEPDYLPYVSF